MQRTFDKSLVLEILQPFRHEFVGQPIEDWLEDENNICLKDENNICLFEKDRDSVYCGHYFFNSARGAKAIKLSQEALELMFSEYKTEVIKGLTPIEKKGAIWLSKRLGFTSYGTVETIAGPAILFILTNQEWRKLNG